MNVKEKNLLDLKHSLSLTKGALFLSIGIGSGIAILLGTKQIGISMIYSLILSIFFASIFIYSSIIHFTKCSNIQNKIKNSK